MNTGITLSTREAYVAMFIYLERLHAANANNELGGILGGLSLLSDGQSADPAAWLDWVRIVEQVKSRDLSDQLLLVIK